MRRRKLSRAILLAALGTTLSASASTAIVVSVTDQKLVLVRDGERLAQYKISTSRFGLGDKLFSYQTPLGKLEIAERIGAGLPLGAVLKGRHATGEVLAPNAEGRDPIVTRILYLRGLEPTNQNAYNRSIYIHGTPVERNLGKPDSWGCIRMRSEDVVALFEAVPVGAMVEIVNDSLRRSLPAVLAASRESATPAPESGPASPVPAVPKAPEATPAAARVQLAVFPKPPAAKTQASLKRATFSTNGPILGSPATSAAEAISPLRTANDARARVGIGLSVPLW